jgi:hypothetical protein
MPHSRRDAETYVDLSHDKAINHLKTQENELATEPSNSGDLNKLLKAWQNYWGFFYHYLRSRFGPRHPYQCYPTADGETGIFRMEPGTGTRVALLSDWATDTVESDAVGFLVGQYQPHYTAHLGDVYFVGAPQEIACNFTVDDASFPYGTGGSFALAGNHEMYSNGNAYFQKLLPQMKIRQQGTEFTQRAGFFCLENDHWRVIGLDTGYTSVRRPLIEYIFPPDCHLRDEQVAWLRDTLRLGDPTDRRGLIFLSHHPYFTAWRKNFYRPAEQLREILGTADRPLVWFWGHEHRLALYEKQRHAKGPEAYGRCIGNGGMPVELDPPRWPDAAPIRYYDSRVRTQIRRTSVGFNGFALLTFEGPIVQVDYRDVNDARIFSEQWEVDPKTGELSHREFGGETPLTRLVEDTP